MYYTDIGTVPRGTYDVIYADCPWSYNDKMTDHSFSLDHEYATQSLTWIKGLPVGELAAKDAVLFHWVVSPQLPEGIDVMRAWGFCCKTGTRILTNDLRWVPAETLQIGDKLTAFDDERPGNRGGAFDRRHFQWATVLSTGIERHQCYEITLEDGTELVCTGEHRWISKLGRKDQARSFDWNTTESMFRRFQQGKATQLWRLMPSQQADFSYESGLLAGAFDGEGCLITKDSWHLGFAQRNNSFLARVEDALTEKGFTFSRYAYPDHAARCVGLKSGRMDAIRLLMMSRPSRLLDKWAAQDISIHSLYDFPSVQVKRVRFVGVTPVVTLMTDRGTYIAEGFGAHNTFKTVAFVWSKRTVTGKEVANLGRWTMGNVEMCLLGVKGRPKRITRNVRQLVTAVRTRHSRKPDCVRERITTLMGDHTARLELFARGDASDGWDRFGREPDWTASL